MAVQELREGVLAAARSRASLGRGDRKRLYEIRNSLAHDLGVHDNLANVQTWPGHQVVLVERSADHVFQPSQLWQMVGQRRPEQFHRPLSRLERKGIEFHKAEVEQLDLEQKLVRTSSGDLGYRRARRLPRRPTRTGDGARVRADGPGPPLHWGKVAFERWWLHHWL